MSTANTLTLADLTALRETPSIAQAQRLLASRGVPVAEWDSYLHMVGTKQRKATDISIRAVDPLRHWHWALLAANGASLRQIGEAFGVRHASVHEGIKQFNVQRGAGRVSGEFLDAMCVTLAAHRVKFADPQANLPEAALELYSLTLETVQDD